jgi:hypothetical protein
MSRRVRSWLLLLGGLCLMAAGLLALRQQDIEETNEFVRVLTAYSTDDPNNPPRVEIEEWWGYGDKRTMLRMTGGKFHLPPGGWKTVQDETSARFAWMGCLGTF